MITYKAFCFNIFLLFLFCVFFKIEILEDFFMSKHCNFAFLLYPESCNSNFAEILDRLNTPVYYILHDKDTIIDGSGEVVPKKPHYHVMVRWENPHSENTARKISLQCGGNGYLERLISCQGYARYLMHLDDEFKYHYDRSEIIVLNDNLKKKYDDIIVVDDRTDNKTEILAEIIRYCNHNNLIAFCQLIDYCVDCRLDWLPIVRRNANMLTAYIKSQHWYNTYN